MNEYFDGFLELIELRYGKNRSEHNEKFKFFWNQVASHQHQRKLLDMF